MIDGSAAPLKLDDELTYQRVVEGTEPRGDGKPAYVKLIPVKVSLDLLKRGQERFTIYCAACHGQGGYGDGIVAQHAAEMQAANRDAGGWVAPKNYHTDDVRQQPVGQLYNTITNGIRTMPAYGKQLSILDRWAVVAYVKALQRSQARRRPMCRRRKKTSTNEDTTHLSPFAPRKPHLSRSERRHLLIRRSLVGGN